MFAIVGIIPLLAFIYVRPQEVFEILQHVPFLYLTAGLAAFGLVIDFRLGLSRLVLAPQAPWAGLFLVWLILVTAIGAPSEVMIPEVVGVVIAFWLFAVIGHGVQTLRGMRVVGGTIGLLCLFLVVVGVHQGLAPKGCVLLDEAAMDDLSGTHDGRSCSESLECYGQEAQPGGDYMCEHIGLLGTTSVHGRVRYRGILQDPNELAFAISCGLPLLFALGAGRPGLRWRLLSAVGVAAALPVLVMTQSRSGLLVFITVLGVYFVRRFGVRGLLVGAVLALPAVLLGGRRGEEASASVDHRLESWQAAFDMLRTSPIFGVGKGMFTEHHFLTAHNSYLLAAAELGVPGYLLWAILLYVSIKVPLVALRDLSGRAEAGVARSWALAVLACMAGTLVAMMFFSLTYHFIPWIHLGLAAALATVIERHLPGFRVRFGARDALLAVGGAVGVLAILAVFLRAQGY